MGVGVEGKKVKIQVWGYRCHRCGHEWVPREKAQDPRVCPACKSPYWDRPRRDGTVTPPAKKAKAAKKRGARRSD